MDVQPELNKEHYLISANLNLNGRRGPLRVSLVKGNGYNQLEYSIESIICRSTELRELKKRAEIREELDAHGLKLSVNNDFLLVRDSLSLDSSNVTQIAAIEKVVIKADQLEEIYTGGDLDEF